MTREEAIRRLGGILTEAVEFENSVCYVTEEDRKPLEMAIKALEQEPRWIPVSEKLPEDEQEILFSTKTGRVHSGKYHDDNSANQWYSHKDKCRAWNNVVSAWMPLPKPYRAERSDKE